MSKQKHTILVAALGGHQVSMTNPRIGTVLVSRRGWAMFRQIVGERGVITDDDKQSDALVELGECFAVARPNGRDRNGDLMLLDKDTRLLFIVTKEDRVLIACFVYVKKKKDGRSTPRADAA